MRKQQKTSIETYKAIKSTLAPSYKHILNALVMNKDMTNMELAEFLGWSINRVTPRIKGLRDQGLVRKSDVRPCLVTGKTVLAWETIKRLQKRLFII